MTRIGLTIRTVAVIAVVVIANYIGYRREVGVRRQAIIEAQQQMNGGSK